MEKKYCFNYENAFSRNLGWFSKEEQRRIASATIAIPGMGGVGGHHLHSLARIGFRNFKIADFDEFEEHNFNRQIGATISSLNKNKALVMRDMILDIIPDANIEVFPDGVRSDNYDSFIEGVDVIVDGLDLYVIKERIDLFDLAISKGIHIVIAGPLGMGTSTLIFKGKGVSFSSYVNINKDMSKKDLVVRFLAALAPTCLHLKYLYFQDEIDLDAGKAPSLHIGALAATTYAASEVTKIVLNRGKVLYTPWVCHYDYYLKKFKHIWRPFGNKNLIQRVVILIFSYLWDKKYSS